MLLLFIMLTKPPPSPPDLPMDRLMVEPAATGLGVVVGFGVVGGIRSFS